MIKMKEIPHLYRAENIADGELFDEMNDLEYNICRMLEDYCIDNGWSFGCYMEMVSYVRNLMAYAWEAGRRQLRERPEQEEG